MGRTFKDSGGKGGYNRSCKWSGSDHGPKKKSKKGKSSPPKNNCGSQPKRYSDQSYDDILREEYGEPQ